MNVRMESARLTARTARIGAVILILGALSPGGHARAQEAWGPFDFLIGAWTGEGAGKPGSGAGEFTFQPGLAGKVLVRKSRADYPAAEGRPAVHHEDLIVVYREGGNPAARAIYFDNEGHVIRYAVSSTASGDTLEFLSDADPAGSTYRLRYVRTGPATMGVTFDMAPAGKPAEFRQYLNGTCRRRK